MGLKIGSYVMYKGENEAYKDFGVGEVKQIITTPTRQIVIVNYKRNKNIFLFKFLSTELEEVTPKNTPITKDEFDRVFFRTSEEITSELIKDLTPSEVLNHMTFIGLFMDKFSANLFNLERENEN